MILKDYLAWVAGNENPTRFIAHTGYLAHGNSKGEGRGRI